MTVFENDHYKHVSHNLINLKRDFYLNVYTIFKSDSINNMDHIKIFIGSRKPAVLPGV